MTKHELELNSLLEVKKMITGLTDADLNKMEELIADAKRLVRADRKETEKTTLVRADGDTAIYKIKFNSKEDAEKYFYRNCEKEYNPSPYDCTGQVFTLWHKVFKAGNGVVLYWEDCIDV